MRYLACLACLFATILAGCGNTIKCKDGRTIQKPKDDFKFFETEYSIRIGIATSQSDSIDSSTGFVFTKSLKRIGSLFDQENNRLMLKLKAAYIPYRDDPCDSLKYNDYRNAYNRKDDLDRERFLVNARIQEMILNSDSEAGARDQIDAVVDSLQHEFASTY